MVVVHPVEKLSGETRSTLSGHDMLTTVEPDRSPPRTLVVDEIAVSCAIFCTKVEAPLGTTKSWTFEKSIVCRISVCTLPWEVRTHPATTKLREDVVVTVTTIGSVLGRRVGVTTGAGAAMVFCVTSPTTRVEPWSRKSSRVAVVEKYWLSLVTLMASRWGCPSLSTPANGERSTRYGTKLS